MVNTLFNSLFISTLENLPIAVFVANCFFCSYDKQQIRKDDKLQQLHIDESVIRKFAEKETFTSVEEIDCVEFVKSLGYDVRHILIHVFD